MSSVKMINLAVSLDSRKRLEGASSFNEQEHKDMVKEQRTQSMFVGFGIRWR